MGTREHSEVGKGMTREEIEPEAGEVPKGLRIPYSRG